MTGFGIENLPYGVFSPPGGARRIGVAFGEDVLDVGAVAHAVGAPFAPLLAAPLLNPLLAAGRATSCCCPGPRPTAGSRPDPCAST